MNTSSILAAAGLALFAGVVACVTGASADVKPASAKTTPAGPLDFTVKTIKGGEQKLSDYKGDVVLIVNVASRCGLTPQYEGLEKLYRKYKDQGLTVIGFPANNFGGQEPGSDEEIQEFCKSKYDVSFPMMSKVSVKGDDKAPLYKFLTEGPTAGPHAGEIGWNFTKFLVGRDGQVVARFDSKVKPEDPQVAAAVEQALAAKPAEGAAKE